MAKGKKRNNKKAIKVNRLTAHPLFVRDGERGATVGFSHSNSKNTLDSYKVAKDRAQDINYPNRNDLLEIYFDIINNDGHLSSLIKQRKSRIFALDFKLINSKGAVDKKTQQLFEEFWFNQFREFSLDALFYGNSLIVLGEGDDTSSLTTKLIPREVTIPEYKEIKTIPTMQVGDKKYNVPIYSNRLVEVNNKFDDRNLGELLVASQLVLFKNEMKLNWSQHIEIFGQAIRVGTYDGNNPKESDKFKKGLSEMGRNAWLLKNSKMKVELLESAAKSASSGMYVDFKDFMDAELSKLILGSTMVTDSGSSRSQAEVHERASFLFTKADIQFLESVVNNQLIPKLKKLGLITTKGIKLEFIEPDIRSTADKVAMMDAEVKQSEFLIKNFEIDDPDYFTNKFGVGLKLKKQEDTNGSKDKGTEETEERAD